MWFGQAEYIFGKQKFVLYVRQKVYDKSLEYFRQVLFFARILGALCLLCALRTAEMLLLLLV